MSGESGGRPRGGAWLGAPSLAGRGARRAVARCVRRLVVAVGSGAAPVWDRVWSRRSLVAPPVGPRWSQGWLVAPRRGAQQPVGALPAAVASRCGGPWGPRRPVGACQPVGWRGATMVPLTPSPATATSCGGLPAASWRSPAVGLSGLGGLPLWCLVAATSQWSLAAHGGPGAWKVPAAPPLQPHSVLAVAPCARAPPPAPPAPPAFAGGLLLILTPGTRTLDARRRLQQEERRQEERKT